MNNPVVLGFASMVVALVLALVLDIARICKDKLAFERFRDTFFLPVFFPVGGYLFLNLIRGIFKMDVNLKKDAWIMCTILIFSAIYALKERSWWKKYDNADEEGKKFMLAEREREIRELEAENRKRNIENADSWDQTLTDMGLMSEGTRKYREIYRRKDKTGQKIMRMKKEADDEWEREWERLSPQEKKKRLDKVRIDREIERRYK